MAEGYVAYMLRLWQVAGGESPVWRASLEEPRTGELRAFASLEALVAFLGDLTRVQPDPQTAVRVGAPPDSQNT